MTGIVAALVLLAWGSMGVLAQSSPSVMGRLSWCEGNTLCMCETSTGNEVRCFEESEILHFIGVNKRAIPVLKARNFTLQTKVYWCSEVCLCHLHTGKEFQCTEAQNLVQFIITNIGNMYFLPIEGDSEIKQETERSVDLPEEPPVEEVEPRRRSERKKNKKNRKKNRKAKNMNRPEDSIREPEAEPEPETPFYTTTTPTPPTESNERSVPWSHYGSSEEDVEEIYSSEEGEPLPKQEAVAASPAVTALQPPTRHLPPQTTEESHTSRASTRDVDGLPPRVQPVMEVPKEKKTMASMVSQDLDDLDTTVRNIKNDVMLNQRILLVTVAITGIAMLGVLILAIMSCTNRRQNQSANAKNKDSIKDDNHSPKINLEEAW